MSRTKLIAVPPAVKIDALLGNLYLIDTFFISQHPTLSLSLDPSHINWSAIGVLNLNLIEFLNKDMRWSVVIGQN